MFQDETRALRDRFCFIYLPGMFSTGGGGLIQNEIKTLLTGKKLTLSTAESCTGGRLSSILTSIPGASEYFLLGCVPYSEEMKTAILDICPETIQKHSTVSSQVASNMARNVRKISGSDIGISTTGYAGPEGGDEENPVGTVYIAISIGDGVSIKRLSLKGNREGIIQHTCEAALDMLRTKIDHLHPLKKLD